MRISKVFYLWVMVLFVMIFFCLFWYLEILSYFFIRILFILLGYFRDVVGVMRLDLCRYLGWSFKESVGVEYDGVVRIKEKI